MSLLINLDEDVLMCPCCGGNNLHQADVTVFTPADGSVHHTARVYYDGGVRTQRVPADWSNNPSRERQGLLITFDCEIGCTADLAIYQHKGCTFVEWQNIAAAQPESN